MSEKFDEYYKRAQDIEGLISNNVNDRGGLTLCGIAYNAWPSLSIWDMYKEHGMEVFKLQEFQAIVKEFYKINFWEKCQCDHVGDKLAWELFEFGINAGSGTSVRCLQQILNAHNKEGSLWADLPTSGNFGPMTTEAFFRMQDQGYTDEDFALMLNAMQFCYYMNITQRTPSQEKFMNGWTKRRVLNKA